VYDLFPTREVAAQFRDDLAAYWRLLAARGHGAAAPPLALPPPRRRADEQCRRVVYLRRRSQGWFSRTVVDEDAFVEFLRHCAAQVGARVTAIHAADYTAEQLASIIGGAPLPASMSAEDALSINASACGSQIVVSLHGGQLGFMVLLPPRVATAIIEMNPCTFFEPRFNWMSKKMNVSYFAFNCLGRCCFGGSKTQFERKLLGSGKLNFFEARRELASASSHDVRARWPASGMVGEPENCGRPCLDLIDRPPIKDEFYIGLRSSSIAMMIGQHPREFARILLQSFRSVDWARADLTEEQFLSAKELQAAFAAAEATKWV